MATKDSNSFVTFDHPTHTNKGYIFPFGEDLEQVLEPNQPERDTGADAARDRVQDEKG